MKYYQQKIALGLLACFTAVVLVACGQGGNGTPQQPQTAAGGSQVLLASTIGPIDAGIIGALEEAYEKKTGIRVRHVGAGTGEAIKIGKSGAVDLVIVHAKALEEQFVAEGFGTSRLDFMYNDFVILGPEADPAGIKGLDVKAAMQKMAAAQKLFVTRGDNSGTHVKEMELWQAAGIKPQGDWYRKYEKGNLGNKPTLEYAAKENAYLVMDRATYLMVKNNIQLQVLVEKDEQLLNYITIIPVNSAKFPNINAKGAEAFAQWLQSAEAQKIVQEFGKDKYGEPLFFPNSPEGKKL
ncbi:MAG: substrate-binding domain-containing protein [Heliobacteriaceae bacterium]|nr:substrate-binding domain-containing protein [Heliobacteriaceae bacterium]